MLSFADFALSPTELGLIVLVVLIGGFVKGAVGFAMPMIIISGVGTIGSAELALVALILPTLATNIWQAFRNGARAALRSAMAHKTYIGLLLVFILIGAQFVPYIPDRTLFLVLGVTLAILAFVQLIGLRLTIAPARRRQAEVGFGTVAGLIGGISGVWGPPTTLYLTALNTPKAEQMRTQGVVYGAGAAMLTLAHVQSGVLTTQTASFSAALILPAFAGVAVGTLAQQRMDQEKFRKATLLVLLLASLNLIRRGLTL